MQMGIWNPADINALISKWSTQSAKQIGDAMTPPKTRSAIVGMVSRLRERGLLPRGGGEKHFEVTPWKPREPRVKPEPTPEPPMIKAPTKPFNGHPAPLDMRPCSLIELADGQCRWPLGELDEPATLFCGGVALPGLPYCAHHSRRAHQQGEYRHERTRHY